MILKYCKSTSSQPNPSGPLSDKVPSIRQLNWRMLKPKKFHASAKIKWARKHVAEDQYLILSPSQRFEVGKRAAKHRVTSALK